jgi:predicted aldo/keto reductase-like oxidoreductase
MEKRELGRTGLLVSAVGFGGIPIQRVDSKEAERVIREALDQGINFFDSARAYSDSEAKIGQALKGVASRPFLATKAGSRTYDGMLQEVETSLRALEVDTIDLYQLHNIKNQQELDQVLAGDGALAALKDCLRQGKIRFIGITSHRSDVLVQALKTGEFATVQFPFNPLERAAEEELLPLARKTGVGTIVMKPLAGGAFQHSRQALRFALQYPVSTVIPGMDSPAQVRANARVGRNPVPLQPQEIKALKEECCRLGRDFCRRCEYCLPCPQGVKISLAFLLDGYWTRYGLRHWAEDRYRSSDAGAGKCIQCGLCETRCPYQLPIREMLARARDHFEKV